MTESEEEIWDHSTDLLIVGSGSAALTAAITGHDFGGEVLVIEKSNRYGGTSAMSGGGLWVPNNHIMAETKIGDSFEEGLDYLMQVTAGHVDEARVRAYATYSPMMTRYMCDRTRLVLQPLPDYADYYPAVPTSKPGARSIEPTNFDARQLGDEFYRMRDQNPQTLIMGRISMTALQARTLLSRSPGWVTLTLKLLLDYLFDLPGRLRSKRDRTLALGNSLVGMLRLSMLDRSIPLWLETSACEFIVDEGRVVGMVVEKDGRRLRIRARKAVILGAGGFEANQAMREKYLPNPTRTEWSAANRHNTGDLIQLGSELGAALEFMDDAWWGPTTVVPGEEHARMLVVEKALPRSIFVDKMGERFCNEAAPYIDVVNAMYARHSEASPCVPGYMIFDSIYRKKYPVGPLLQATQQPDWMLPKAYRQNYLYKADTLEALAQQMGIDPQGLAKTVEKVNAYAETGIDLDYHRGENRNDTYYGDPTVEPNPCLGPISQPPFYGIEIQAGELGTKGGLKTDAHARVLRESGARIPGLYAAGNCSGAVMGHTYAGAGSTIGPAMTFGWVAALDALDVPEEEWPGRD